MARKRKSAGPKTGEVRLVAVMSNFSPPVVFEAHPSLLHAGHSGHLAYSGDGSHPVESRIVSTDHEQYRLAYVAWDGYARLVQQVVAAKPDMLPGVFGDDVDLVVGYTGLSRRTILRHARLYRANPESLSRVPLHRLDIPDVVVGCTEHHAHLEEFTDRARALAAAARANAKRKRHSGGGDWAIVLQLGDFVVGSVRSETRFAGDVGAQRETFYCAVRIVRATEEEVRRHGRAMTTARHTRRSQLENERSSGRVQAGLLRTM